MIEKDTINEIRRQYQIGIDYSSGKDHAAICIFDEQAEAVIKAINKQMPKEALISKRFHGYMKCPSCGRYMKTYDNYCSKCGQAIKMGGYENV